jgi:hypothetical protein
VAAQQHQRFLIVAVDHYSKWPEVTAVGTVTTSTVIKFLSTLFERYELIEECITDNGVQFTSAEFRVFFVVTEHSTLSLCKLCTIVEFGSGTIQPGPQGRNFSCNGRR